MTLLEPLEWCRLCGQAPCLCPICHGAKYLRGPGPMGTTTRCVCNPEPAPVDPPEPAVRQPRRTYADRLDS